MKSQKQVSNKSLISYHKRLRKSKGLHFTDPISSARRILCKDDLQHSLRARRNWKNVNTRLFSKILSRGKEATIAGGVYCDAVYQTTRRHMPVTTATTAPCTSHSGTDTPLCALRHKCLYCGDVWRYNCCELHVCIHMLGCGAGGHNWHSPTVSAKHLPDVQLNVSLYTSLWTFKAKVSNVELVLCDHRTVRLFRRSRKVIVGSNPKNSGYASKPNIFTFPSFKMCGLWIYWGIDFSVVVVGLLLLLLF